MSDYLKEGFIDEVKGALKGEGGSGQDNVIEKIKVNGVEQAVDPNKAVDIPVPTKTSELENDEGFLTEHQDLSDYAKKADVPTVPTNVSEFTNDSDYQTSDDVSNALEPYAKSSDVATQITEGIAKVVADAPEDFDTLKEMSDWIASHENDASAMNSAISDNKNGISELNTNMAAHTGDKNNPHAVTKDQVGLGNVDNTADLDKPVSKAQATAIADAKKAGTDAQNNLTSHIGNTNNPHSVTKSQVGLGNVGNFKAVSTVASQGLSDTEKSNARTNIGLGKVDNTADLDKPISTATQTALDDINRNLEQLEFGEFSGASNIFKVNTTNWTLTDNGIKNNAQNSGESLGKITLIAGKTYTMSFLLKSKPTEDATLSGFIGNTEIPNISFVRFHNFNLGVRYVRTYTPTSDCELSYKLYGNANSDIFEFQFQVEEGSVATDYEPYIPSVKMLAEENEQINESLDELEYSDVAGGKNLFNDLKITNEIYINDSLVESYASGVFTSDYIKVEPSTDYTWSGKLEIAANGTNRITYYDSNKSVISQIKATKNGQFTYIVTTPSNCAYVRIGTLNTFSNFMLEKGSIATDYEPYIPSVKMLADENEQINSNLDYNANKNLAPEYDEIVNSLDYYSDKIYVYPSTNYTISFDIQRVSGVDITNTNIYPFYEILEYDANDNLINNYKNETIQYLNTGTIRKSYNYITKSETSYLRINFNNFNGDNNKNTRKFNLQVEAGNTPSDYIPYRGRSNNLLTEEVMNIKKDLGNYAPKANPTFTGTVQVGSKGIVAVNADDEQIALELQGVTIGTDGDYLDAFELREQGDPLSVLYMAKSTGADYAEYFEWADKNPNDEDRVGYFVTFDENDPEKIRYANEGDYILGIVSGMPNVIGNDDNGWSNRYILDEFGRRIEEEFEFEETVIDEETGEKTTVTKTGTKWEENPEYDKTKPYTPRKERPEWSAIGMLGVLSVYDDGTCQVNGYCKCSDNGVATSSEDGYRIIARVSDNIIKIVFR